MDLDGAIQTHTDYLGKHRTFHIEAGKVAAAINRLKREIPPLNQSLVLVRNAADHACRCGDYLIITVRSDGPAPWLARRPLPKASVLICCILPCVIKATTRAMRFLRSSICVHASEHGVEIAPILNEAAALSSDIDKYGMGSTRSFLLGACQDPGNESSPFAGT